MNFICTWLCADELGEESVFYQTGELSSSRKHQNIYWRCLLVFFITSRRFNKKEKHILFTNVRNLPIVDGRNMSHLLKELEVEVVCTDFKYKTPKGYYGAFQNQFYEFSILEYISQNSSKGDDLYLLLDSDCVFLKSVAPLFSQASKEGFISFEDEVSPSYVINGLSRNDLKDVYEQLMGHPIHEIPSYHLGEFMLSSTANIRKFFSDFLELWPSLLERHKAGQIKFNEEAHTLSYLYFKNGFRACRKNIFMRRIWTNQLFYREVRDSDVDLAIWHLPAEKTFGLFKLYAHFVNKSSDFDFSMSDDHFTKLVQKAIGIPYLPFKMKMEYYTISYYKAIKKRFKKVSFSTLFS
jgi:hypothetical protein